MSKDTTIGCFHGIFITFLEVVLDLDIDTALYLKTVFKASDNNKFPVLASMVCVRYN
jgi:hypothetical protein